MSTEVLFRRRTAQILVTLSVVALAMSVYLLIFATDPIKVDSAGADTYSVSALGYRALVELLESDVPVLISRQDSAHKAKPQSPLLILEPSGQPDRIERLKVLLEVASKRQITTVVVLPKWTGKAKSDREEWVERVDLRPGTEPARVVREAFALDTELANGVQRPVGLTGAWRGESAELGEWIQLTERPQLLARFDEDLVEVLGLDQGMLIARSADERLWVIADPDLLNTAGLGRGDNALAVRTLLVDRLAPEALIVDEVLHGFGETRNLWRELIRFPLICVTLHCLALAVFALWATTSRFGRPLEAPSRLPPGKLTLVDNTARLLSLSGDLKRGLKRYLELTVRHTAGRYLVGRYSGGRYSGGPYAGGGGYVARRQTPGDKGSTGSSGLHSQVAYLAALGRDRGVSEDLEHLATRIARWSTKKIDARQALDVARALHRWRKEMLDGPSGHSPAR